MRINCTPSLRRGAAPLLSTFFRSTRICLAVATAAFALQSAQAQSAWAPASVFVQAGHGGPNSQLTLGATFDTPWRWSVFGGALSLYGEASIARWSYPADGRDGYTGLTQIALVPVLRYRGSGGASPWFAEAGIGAAYSDKLYERGHKQFSTRWNFADHIGVGRNFGARGEHELVLRIEHYSNGGIREPNPGQDYVQLRYAYRFD